MEKALEAAERKARLRDIENSQVLSQEELDLANQLQAKANAGKMKLVPEKKVKNKAKFAQIIQPNWGYLFEIDYLKTEEYKFLNRVIPYIGFRSNCLVDDINKKSPVPLSQSDLAQKLGSSKPTVSRLVKQLIDKGIMSKAESGKDDVNARMYALYINPHIIYCGDRDNINETLQTMFRKTPKALKKLPERLF
ncbi:helix-turn-helix domain-containing protein [Priestia aryabhattai]|uniref:MarR family transcriptional regulator n=1 Tax=Priestia TaxID=2800373 RepID=UPI000B03DAB1|nr:MULTISPECIES: helix-turn-helix domain-containing protein [Priestia]MDC7767312.1 helix-turn-helix domain-containing protein [Priestia aryabhattai]MDN3365545.1 helix-turn-helix domain-containing protein [Priestia megaterium]MEC1068226.1 helix-turn-helix domain-containing protein [Priestia megaterium]MED4102828.1 helix-turn-helix domain-containing protein [Priestia megaterium]MED4168110.1 helix-turn-helix domain-containing protein [Priestia megaterium]